MRPMKILIDRIAVNNKYVPQTNAAKYRSIAVNESMGTRREMNMEEFY